MQLLHQSIDDLNQQLNQNERLEKYDGLVLIGPLAALDSLAFVNFIAAVEEKCEGQFGRLLSVSDVLSQSGEVRTLGELADALLKLLRERADGSSD